MTLEIQTAELSSADQIMIAVTHVYQAHGDDPPARAVAAVVLAAAADQADAMDVPEYIQGDAYWPYRNGRDAAKEHFLAIAAELGDGATLPPGYIDAEHTGHEREMLEVFYKACRSEGGTTDEIQLRGLKAVFARFGRPAIEPELGEGEVDELIQCLRTRKHFLTQEGASLRERGDGIYFGRAADMLARYARPAIKPVPEPGEVGELVAALRDPCISPLLRERTRAATLLQQLSAIEDLNDD